MPKSTKIVAGEIEDERELARLICLDIPDEFVMDEGFIKLLRARATRFLHL